MKKIIELVFIALTLCLGAGCSDFLEEESQDEVIPQTAKDFGELLLGAGYPSTSESAGSIVGYLDDDKTFDTEGYMVGGTQAEEMFPYVTWQPAMFQWGAGVGASASDYYKFFERIKGCNAVLNYIDGSIGTQAERDQVKAEALAVRAFHYFWLVNLYGEPYNYNKTALGVPLKLDVDVSEKGLARSTVEKVYEQILGDLNASAKLFEKYNVVIGNYKINLPAVKILLSRVYLYMERWEEAAAAATDAIRVGGSLTDLTQFDGTKLVHMNTYDISEVTWIYGNNIAGPEGFWFSEDLVKAFSADDKRLDIYIIVSGSSHIANKNQATYEPGQTLRIAEAYLNRAEAYARMTGKQSDAMSDLNTLRAHRITGYQNTTIADANELLDAIRLERRKELCYEGHRWFDLRRYGMPAIKHVFKADQDSPVLTYTLKEKDPMYTLPLPASVTDKNTSLEQNESAYGPTRTGEAL